MQTLFVYKIDSVEVMVLYPYLVVCIALHGQQPIFTWPFDSIVLLVIANDLSACQGYSIIL